VRRPPAGARGSSRPARASTKSSSGAKGPFARRGEQPPTWRASFGRAGVSAAILLAVFYLVLKQGLGASLSFALLALLFYAPLFYMSDSMLYRRRQRRRERESAG
jgi:Flp pilus assembly protein TadB